MPSRSLFQPRHVSKEKKDTKVPHRSSQSSLQAPNIFIFPPEEDDMPPWCCYDATQGVEDDSQDANVMYDYKNTHYYPPYFRQNVVGIVSHDRGAANSETRSIVDALGDADDYSDNEAEKEHIDEEDEDDVLDSDMDFGRVHSQGRHYHYQRARREMVESYSPQEDPGDDSDVIEVVKVSRRMKHELSFAGPNDTTKSLRFRATKALRSLRGTIRSASKPSTNSKESSKVLSKVHSVKGRTSKSKPSSRPRVQEIFTPVENITDSNRPESPEVPRRPSSRLAQLFAPTLKRRGSVDSVSSPTSGEPSAPSFQKFEPRHARSVTAPAQVNHQTSIDFSAPSDRTSSETQVQRPITVGDEKEEPQAQDSYKQSAEADGENTPTWQASMPSDGDRAIRSASPTPTFELRAISPTLSLNHRARKRFSGLNLQKLFHKSNLNLETPSLTGPSLISSTASTSGHSRNMSNSTIPDGDSKEPQVSSHDRQNIGTTKYNGSSTTLPVGRTSTSTIRNGSAHITSSDNTTAESSPPIKETGNLTSKPTPKPLSNLDINLSLDLNVNLDLDLNPKISIPPNRQARHPPSRTSSAARRGSSDQNNVTLSRGLTLKTISSKFGLRPSKIPSSPPREEEDDLSVKMRLDSLYFDDLSFDADQFIAR